MPVWQEQWIGSVKWAVRSLCVGVRVPILLRYSTLVPSCTLVDSMIHVINEDASLGQFVSCSVPEPGSRLHQIVSTCNVLHLRILILLCGKLY